MIVTHSVAAVRNAEGVLLRAELPPAGPPRGTLSTLMQRAAAGLANACVRELRRTRGRVVGTRVGILVGTGDNGGDALAAGARLAARGAQVTAVLTGDRAHSETLSLLKRAGGQAHRLGDLGVAEASLRLLECDLILDGILGIGASGGLREPAAELVRLLERDRRPIVVAVDLRCSVYSVRSYSFFR